MCQGSLMIFALAMCGLTSAGVYARLQNQSTGTPPRSTLEKIEREDQRTPPLLITGIVRLEDETAPTESVRVEMVCNGQVVQQVSSGTRGQFRFDMANQTGGGWGDPTVSGQSAYRIGLGGAAQTNPGTGGVTAGDYHHRFFARFDLSGCELRVAPSSGYASDVIRLGVRGALESPDVGPLTLHPLSRTIGTTVSLTTLSAPEKAQKAFEKAKKELSRSGPNFDKAGRDLRKAVEIYPDFAEAWDLLARTSFARTQFDDARSAFEMAIAVDEKFVSPYLGLAQIEIERQNWPEAIGLTQKVKELNPNVPQAYYLSGLAFYYSGQLTESREAFAFVVESGYSAAYPLALLHLGIIHAGLGEISAAMGNFEQYLTLTPAEQIPQWHRDRIQEQVDNWAGQSLIDAERQAAFDAGAGKVPQ